MMAGLSAKKLGAAIIAAEGASILQSISIVKRFTIATMTSHASALRGVMANVNGVVAMSALDVGLVMHIPDARITTETTKWLLVMPWKHQRWRKAIR